jgi:hypothetical protein
MSATQQSITRVTQVWPVWLHQAARADPRIITREASNLVGSEIQPAIPGVPLKTMLAKQIFEKNPKKIYTTLYANKHYPATGR